MAIKEFFRKYQPLQIYIVLVLTIFYFLIQLVVSHVTHALTLLVDAYHVLCNLIALFGCIASLKHHDNLCENSSMKLSLHSAETLKSQSESTPPNKCSPSETRLRNTFGWARIEVLVMLIGCIFLTSLCFSLMLEAAQTLGHIDHHDAMHHPLQVLIVGAVGLLLNGVCYFMIGGYTYSQGSFLRVEESGDITLTKGITDMISTENPAMTGRFKPKRQGLWEVARDVIGSIFVMICSLIVHLTDADPEVAKFVDPILAIISATLLLILSYPFMRDAGYILLQTIPNHIDIETLCSELVEAFPNILNVHEIHVWQLNTSKTVATAHIIFLNPKDYLRSTTKLLEFLHQQGISHVTIQPEFYEDTNQMELISSKYGSAQCLIRCMNEECNNRHCCSTENDQLTAIKIPDEVKPMMPSKMDTSFSMREKAKSSNCAQHKRQYMRNSTPILHLLKSAQHSQRKIQIVKASDMSPKNFKSCAHLNQKDCSAPEHTLKRSMSADHVS